MSFHPTMPYGTDNWHRSMRATLPEGPEFAYTPERRQQFAIEIRPGVAPPPLVRVGVRVETQVGPRTAPVLPVAQFCDRLALAREIMDKPDSGCEHVPIDQVVDGRERLQRRIKPAGRMRLSG